jgi:hypothetical protein
MRLLSSPISYSTVTNLTNVLSTSVIGRATKEGYLSLADQSVWDTV